MKSEHTPVPLEKDGAPAPGFYLGVDYKQYASWMALNHSTLLPYARSALHGRHAEMNPESTSKAKSLGSTAHVAILEPERFEKTYIRRPNLGNPKRKATEQAYENFRKAQEELGLEPVPCEEWDLAITMREALYSHPTIAELLSAPGVREACIVWIDPETGIKCKARLDAMCMWRGYSIILDLKTCLDARAKAVERTIGKFSYHTQAAFYRQGAYMLDPGMDRKCALLFVESKEPHGVMPHQINVDSLDRAESQNRVAIRRYAKAKETGRYPGYDPGMGLVDAPRWGDQITEEL